MSSTSSALLNRTADILSYLVVTINSTATVNPMSSQKRLKVARLSKDIPDGIYFRSVVFIRNLDGKTSEVNQQ